MENAIDQARQLYAVLDAEDVAPFLARCAPEVTVEHPAAGRLPYGGTWVGRDRVGEFLAAHESAKEILVFEPRQFLSDGDVVVVLGHFEG